MTVTENLFLDEGRIGILRYFGARNMVDASMRLFRPFRATCIGIPPVPMTRCLNIGFSQRTIPLR